MILGGPVLEPFAGPEEWTAAIKRRGYGAAYCPVDEKADAGTIKAYAEAAARSGIVIAEVGAWSNPLSRDDARRKGALKLCKARLALADEIGASCCVNISGSRSRTSWCGPDPDNYRKATFDMIVGTVREIIDAVKPVRTFYTLEAMPWVPPDTSESYASLLKAIDRKACAVHFDPVNLLWSPERVYGNAAVIKEFVSVLGGAIKSCHAKDVAIADDLSVKISEVRPGTGLLDYRSFIRALDSLGRGVPLMIEHLASEDDYALAADHIREVAAGL